MEGYARLVAENRRLEILRILEQDADYATNEAILQRALEMLGLAATTDQVGGDVAWLAEQGLVTASTVGGLRLVKITRRGLDAAKGTAGIPGVARPLPEDCR